MITFAPLHGEMLEWLKRHAWKVCISVKGYPGFESLSLRFHPPKLDRAKEGSSSASTQLIGETKENVQQKFKALLDIFFSMWCYIYILELSNGKHCIGCTIN